jgi:hypothetical protein
MICRRFQTCVLTALVIFGTTSVSQAAFDLSANNASGDPGQVVTTKVNVAGGMLVDSLNIAAGVDSGALIVDFRSTGISSIWDAAVGSPPFLTSGAAPVIGAGVAATVISNSLTAEGDATGTGVVLELDIKIPLSANVGDMIFLNINEQGFTSVSLDGASMNGDLNFLNTGNGAGIAKITVVPEPSSFLLIGLCGSLAYGGRWLKKRAKKA